MFCSVSPKSSISRTFGSSAITPRSAICRKPFPCHLRGSNTSRAGGESRWAVRNTSSLETISSRGAAVLVNSDGTIEDPSSPTSPSHSRETRQNDTFLSDDSVTWSSLGLSAEVSAAFLRANLLQPSLVQVVSIPEILSGEDVIIAAEIGSGKTHAYLAPIFERTLRKRREADYIEKQLADRATPILQSFSLVLCLNDILCQQVVDMASMLQSDLGETSLDVTAICGGQDWPLKPPDVVVATPAALLDHIFAFDPKHRRRQAFVRDVSCVVFDEADMLLGGGLRRQVGRLINMFRLEEKQLAKSFSSGSTRKKLENIHPWTEFKVEEDDKGNLDAADNEVELDDNEDEGLLAAEQDYQRSKQYIFVAGTLPNVIVQSPPAHLKRRYPAAKIANRGENSPGALLKRLFPAAKSVNGNLLHFHNPRINQRWVEVSRDTIAQALLEAISEGHQVAGDQGAITTRTMVFANSVDVVDAISRVLRKVGIGTLTYHAGISVEKRREILQIFKHDGGVLVCTDAAARGIDIPKIGQIIQAEFAKTAVDFLHRVGRTGRAGQSGLVTNFFTDANRRLVEALRNSLIERESVEDTFYPKRSVRKMAGAFTFKERRMMRAKHTS